MSVLRWGAGGGGCCGRRNVFLTPPCCFTPPPNSPHLAARYAIRKPLRTRACFAKCRMLPRSWRGIRWSRSPLLPRPRPLTASDSAKPLTVRGIRASIHSRLTQSLIDLDVRARGVSSMRTAAADTSQMHIYA